MNWKEKIAGLIAPGLRTEAEIKDLVETEVKKAKMSLPIMADYDPRGEGYRRLSGDGSTKRDLSTLDQGRMFEIAYFMFDRSPMTRRLAKMDKSFLFAEPISITSEDEAVQEVIDNFWRRNELDLDLPDQIMWLGLLGEQCWPVEVNEHNGEVVLGYVDPAGIKDVWVNPRRVKEVWQVELLGRAGRTGQKMPVIREDRSALSPTFGRLVGETFFFSINHPPNSPRGRSDLLALFDWIDGLERYAYNYLERAEFMLNFIWDVTMKGATAEQIRDWLQDNAAPEPGSTRVHNEQVEWKTVAPDLKAPDFKTGFDASKGFIMGAAGRPDSWFGSGGKAYQTEAELMDMVPVKDLDERQLLVKKIITKIIRFVLDQAVIHGRLTEAQAENGFEITMPKISKKDLSKLSAGLPQVATALALAETNNWISGETATKLFAAVAGQLGVDIDVAEEIEKAKTAPKKDLEDYLDD